jgi:urease accessory protein
MIRLAALLLLAASPAAAHGTLPGGGGFYAGAAHPFLAGDHLLLLIGLGVLLGRLGLRRPLLGLLAGLVTGFGLTLLHLGPLQPAILMLAVVIGGVLAAAIRINGLTAIVIATIAGLLIGADTDGPTGGTAIIAYAGVTAAVFLIVLNSMALAHYGGGRLNGVPLRVAGSWIAAAAILVLAFLARGAVGVA